MQSSNFILIFAVITAGRLNFALANIDPDEQAGIHCGNIGISTRNGSNLDNVRACKEKMKELTFILDKTAITQITFTLGNPTELSDIESIVKMFHFSRWGTQTIKNVVKNFPALASGKKIFTQKVINFAGSDWWDSIASDEAFEKAFDLRKIIFELINDEKHIISLLTYKNWWNSNGRKFTCFECILMEILKFNGRRDSPLTQDEFYGMFNAVCSNKSAAENWNHASISQVLNYMNRAPLKTVTYFLKVGQGILQISKYSGTRWSVRDICEEVEKCYDNDCVDLTIKAIQSAHTMDICPVAYNGSIEVLRILYIPRVEFMNFLTDIKKTRIVCKTSDTHEDMITYFVSIYCAKYSNSVPEIRGGCNNQSVLPHDSIDMFIQAALSRGWGLRIQNEYMKLAARNKFQPNEYLQFLDALENDQTPDKVLSTMEMFGRLGINGTRFPDLWQIVKKHKIKTILSIFEHLKAPNITVEPAIYGYLMKENLNTCDDEIVKALAVYNAAINFTMFPTHFVQLYNSVRSNKNKTVTVIQQATSQRISVFELITRLNSQN